MSYIPTPTIPGHFVVQQFAPSDPIYILGPEPQNRFVARIEEGTMQDAQLLAASREMLEIIKELSRARSGSGRLTITSAMLLVDAMALIAKLEPPE
jgi:hypothetical protein